MGPLKPYLNKMNSVVLFGLLLVGSVSCQDPWHISLHTLENGAGAWTNITEFTNDLTTTGFNNVAKSVCGHGVWLLYSEENYERCTGLFCSYWVEQFVSLDYSCHNFPSTRHGQLSSVRFVGSGVFANTTNSMIVVGSSPWTIYSGKYFSGASICLEPSPLNGLNYGAWQMSDLSIPNNAISSLEMGCNSDKVLKY